MKKKVKSIMYTMGIIVVAILFIIAILNAGAFYNDMVLNSFSKQLYNCNMPGGTVIVEKQKICGKLNGNGDGMDFLAVILVKSDKTIDELKDHFESLSFKGAKPSSKTAKIQVLEVTDNKLQSEYLEHKEIKFTEIIGKSDKYYAVVIYDGGYWTYFDLRGV